MELPVKIERNVTSHVAAISKSHSNFFHPTRKKVKNLKIRWENCKKMSLLVILTSSVTIRLPRRNYRCLQCGFKKRRTSITSIKPRTLDWITGLKVGIRFPFNCQNKVNTNIKKIMLRWYWFLNYVFVRMWSSMPFDFWMKAPIVVLSSYASSSSCLVPCTFLAFKQFFENFISVMMTFSFGEQELVIY